MSDGIRGQYYNTPQYGEPKSSHSNIKGSDSTDYYYYDDDSDDKADDKTDDKTGTDK
jgi:hypothetical protein